MLLAVRPSGEVLPRVRGKEWNIDKCVFRDDEQLRCVVQNVRQKVALAGLRDKFAYAGCNVDVCMARGGGQWPRDFSSAVSVVKHCSLWKLGGTGS